MVDTVSNQPMQPERGSESPLSKKQLKEARAVKNGASAPSTDVAAKRERLHQKIGKLSAVVSGNDDFGAKMHMIASQKQAKLFAAKVTKLVDDVEKYGASESDKKILKASLDIIHKTMKAVKTEGALDRLFILFGQEHGVVVPESVKEAQKLLRALTDKELGVRDIEGRSVIEVACLAGNKEYVDAFIKEGRLALLKEKDHDGDTPLQVLCTGLTGENVTARYVEVAKLLTQNMTKEELSSKNRFGETAADILISQQEQVTKKLEQMQSEYKTAKESDKDRLLELQSDLLLQIDLLRQISDLVEQ